VATILMLALLAFDMRLCVVRALRGYMAPSQQRHTLAIMQEGVQITFSALTLRLSNDKVLASLAAASLLATVLSVVASLSVWIFGAQAGLLHQPQANAGRRSPLRVSHGSERHRAGVMGRASAEAVAPVPQAPAPAPFAD
jgi:cytochrome bd-type quinol oxidase subunit 2